MTDIRQLTTHMERAYAQGDLRSARSMARQVIAQGAKEPGDDADARLAAEALLQRTQPDAFLLVIGMLGLGLTVWLVYNYIL